MNLQSLQHIINGQKSEGTSNKIFDIINPAKEETIAQIKGASKEDVRKAIDVAYKTFKTWSKTPASKIAHLMFDFRDLLIKNIDELAELISREHGKTLEDAKGEVSRGIEVVEFCTSMNSHLKSDYSLQVSQNVDSYNIRSPLGVCAGITPFNFPAMVPMWMFPVAIACGNTFVLKPSEKDPSATLRITELFHEAGFPAGVLNTVVGDKEAVDEILQNNQVEAVSFVGSTPVGQYIYQEGCKHNKRVQSLCGAKNHMVIMPDADIDQSCNAVLGAAFGSAGERCMAISVLVAVGDEVADKILEKLVPKVKKLKVGSYQDKNNEMGPVISKESQQRILNYIDQGLEKGANLIVDGREITKQKGYFVGACIFDNVTKDMSIYREEIFGPILSVVRVSSYEEALRLVDEHEFGNGAAIFTRDGDTARDFTINAQAGMIGVNVPIPVPVANHSFGGWKNSLFGANSIHGMEGVRFYTKLKTITSRWPSSIKNEAVFNFNAGKDQK